jgi:1,4-dihydroxy-2-naphthoate octaprenyltransferase
MQKNKTAPKSDQSERTKAVKAIKILLFSASIVPSLVAGSMAYKDPHFTVINFILVAFALFIGQAGGDYLYYYFTHYHKDNRDSHTKIFAGWQPLFTKLIGDRGTLYAGIICLLLDLLAGIYFTYHIGYSVLVLALIGGFVAIFFTPLMLRGYKEPVIFVTFGPLCMVGVYLALTGRLSLDPLLVSLPLGFFVTVVAYLKGAHFEIGKNKGDEVILNLSSIRVIMLYILGYLSIILLDILRLMPTYISIAMLVPMMGIINIVKVLKKKESRISDYLWAVVGTIILFIITGLAIASGILLY